ncbi:MAG: hypothetical protein JWO36_2354 [Myxococcales bacterium]|nr:hypothetical protein [Myxococcales bacterium]
MTKGPSFAFVTVALIACGGGHGNNLDASSGDDSNTGGSDALVDSGPPTDAFASFGLTAIFPAAASRTVDTALSINGYGINGTPTIHLTNCDQPSTTYDLVAGAVTPTSIATLLAASPTRVQGAYTVTVTNGDGMVASLTCALHILAEPPPTVTLVVPTTAWQGDPMDNINSDVTVSIQGTGFLSTPNVRWVSTSNPAIYFDATFVGYVSSTHLTAIVPSETQMMAVGTYNVFVTNPDNLTAEWKNGATPGAFTITATPPPAVTDVNPARIQNGSCTSTPITITGTGFLTGATAWYVAPAGTTCTGSITDPSGQTLCPITVDAITATAITVHFANCPALGPYPVVVINPDQQSAYWYSIEITPSSSGHLNVGAFETAQNRLETARWKHAAQFGFDSYSDAFVYVAGGQDANNNVLGSVEASQFDLFGTPGPFHHVEQYGSGAAPRVPNNLNVAREGSTLVRVGKTLFSIGGTTLRSDTTTVVAASKAVERAEILSYNQMPAVMLPSALPMTQGLPLGSWYYRVSAIGPWGESLATREVVAINKRGQIQICWVAPTQTGAVSYNIYRSLASDGHAGGSSAIAYEVTSANNCWTDTGVEKQAPAPGNLRGSLAAGGTFAAGTYTYRVSAVVPLTGGGTWESVAGYSSATTINATDVTAGNQTVLVAWDALPITGATYRLYRLDPVSGTYKLLAGADALAATSFTDTNVAFATPATTPITGVLPLPPGSLSKWDSTTPPALNFAREGLDGVVVAMDPATSGGLVARIIVAGGRDGTGGTYTYRTSAESLGINMDGTTEAAWTNETPVFAHARAYYALLTTQFRNETPFPPPPEPPPCGNCGQVIQRTLGILGVSGALQNTVATHPTTIANLVGTEPVYIVAVLGDDAYAASSNAGRNDFESCPVDMTTGHLVANCGVTGGTSWIVQTSTDPHSSFGHDAVLYFSYLYPFYGVQTETLSATGTAIQLVLSSIARFPLAPDLTMIVGGQILQNFQSASTSFIVHRAYYQMTRLLAYVYVLGGYAEAHTENGVNVPAGPTYLVERHQQ